MDNANGNASGVTAGNAAGDGADTASASASASVEPPLPRKAVTSAMQAALGPGMEQGRGQDEGQHDEREPARHGRDGAPRHTHGAVLEGGDSPSVLAQPASASSEGQGSRFHPEPARSFDGADRTDRAKRMIAGAQDKAAAHYRRVTENTDDYVHDNPWKSIAFAAIAGLIVGLLAAR